MTDAPKRIWAFYAPHIADDESGATIVAYTEKQHGGHELIRADLHEAQLVALRDMVEARLRDAVENLTIAIGMGWDLDGVVAAVRAALKAAK